MARGMTEGLANFVVATGCERIPREANSIAKNAILDCIGVTIAGSSEPAPKIMAEQANLIGAVGEAGVICQNFRTSVGLAAWINGAASHVLDYDDTFSIAADYGLHPTVTILPAVLALGEKCKASGRDTLTAYIIGIEVAYRLGSALGRYIEEVGWHPTAILGVIGATAASAKILRLDAWQTQMALGIASSLAGGLIRNFGTMTKSLHAGNAARGGVVAALLARSGFTADPDIVEGDAGFSDMFSSRKVTELTNEEQDLENTWNIVSKGIAFKPYPCCRGTHSGVDAMLYLRKEYEIRADQVAAITCKTRSAARRVLMYDQPKSGLEAKFSLQYCIAVALLRGKVLLEDFTNDKVNEPAVQGLIPKVSYFHPKEWEKEPLTQEVVVKLNNGTEYAHKVTLPKGEPGNPMTDDELFAKFRDCAHSYLAQTEIDQIQEIVINLESLESISRLMEILTYTLGVTK